MLIKIIPFLPHTEPPIVCETVVHWHSCREIDVSLNTYLHAAVAYTHETHHGFPVMEQIYKEVFLGNLLAITKKGHGYFMCLLAKNLLTKDKHIILL